MEAKENIFGSFIMYPFLMADASEEESSKAKEKGDTFKAYIWDEESGLDSRMKTLLYPKYGNDLRLILFQFFVTIWESERKNYKPIERYRPKEKSIGLSFFIEEEFFGMSDKERKKYISSLIWERLNQLAVKMKKRKYDTDFDLLLADAKEILFEWGGL